MPCLMWRHQGETGYLDFLGRQRVGRDCFPGSPQSLPMKSFDLFMDREEWLIWSHSRISWEWHKVSVRLPGQPWQKLGPDPMVLTDGTMLRMGIESHDPKMVLRLTECQYATEIARLWDLPAWEMEEEPEEPDLIATSATARHTAKGLVWIAWFLTRYQWAAVGAISIVGIGLFALSSGYIKIPPGNNDNKTLRN